MSALEALGMLGARVTASTAACLVKCGREGVLFMAVLPTLARVPGSGATILGLETSEARKRPSHQTARVAGSCGRAGNGASWGLPEMGWYLHVCGN